SRSLPEGDVPFRKVTHHARLHRLRFDVIVILSLGTVTTIVRRGFVFGTLKNGSSATDGRRDHPIADDSRPVAARVVEALRAHCGTGASRSAGGAVFLLDRQLHRARHL